MAYIHSNTNTCDHGQVCKSCGQDTEVTVYKLGGRTWKKDCNNRFDGLTGDTHVEPVNALRLLLK